MVDKTTTEYLAPFYTPTLNKWVVMERNALALARQGAHYIPMHLFDEYVVAEQFYLQLTTSGMPRAGQQLH